jgi:predicted nucleic acid-binding protein
MAASRAPLRVFFDTSALIAGTHSRTGASSALLQLASLGVIEGHISEDVRIEAERNVRAKLPAALPALRVMLDEVLTIGPLVSAAAIAQARPWAHQKDQPILAAALAQDCRYLVTLNERDFWPPEDMIVIIRPAELMEAIRTLVGGLVDK